MPPSMHALALAATPRPLVAAQLRAAETGLVNPNNLSFEPLVLGITIREAGMVSCLVFIAIAAVRAFQGKDVIPSPLALWTSCRSVIVTVVACSIFMVVGPALMMLNKYLMDDLHFHYPIAICSLGLVSSSLVSRIIVCLGIGEVREASLKMVSGLGWFQIAGSIGLMKALTMSTGNAVYLHLSFGFIQMLKAFTPLIVLVVMRVAGVKLPTRAAMWCVTLIVAGTVVEVNGELHATALGLCLMLSSEFFEAISVVLSQKVLQNNRFSVLEGMYIIAPAGAACLLAGVAALELPTMLGANHHLIPFAHPWPFFFAAVLGVAINFISFLVMQLTSALTMKILNTARSVGLVIVGVLFYGEEHPLLQMVGYVVALLGFAGYNYFQLYPDAAHSVETNVDIASSHVVPLHQKVQRRELRQEGGGQLAVHVRCARVAGEADPHEARASALATGDRARDAWT
eukprot:CAMPEP_0204532826 /NCGR_PEP_ID=MMETSP0661-20131031/11928_1 /ASSEMBLY_ACC=CAM_ASM_000606 /TAXON_ID=109239 /ORGANISM="Alexandrium margalefi, Strain AMGDE01CS-322" /LENGTH=456 /DNA_ID=CAMNT_0051539097 /DNA_START=422 /DNA_END=1791 /DNA_ORIENTATION=+